MGRRFFSILLLLLITQQDGSTNQLKSWFFKNLSKLLSKAIHAFILCAMEAMKILGKHLTVGAEHLLTYMETGVVQNASTFHGELVRVLVSSAVKPILRENAIEVTGVVVQELTDHLEEGFEEFYRVKIARMEKERALLTGAINNTSE